MTAKYRKRYNIIILLIAGLLIIFIAGKVIVGNTDFYNNWIDKNKFDKLQPMLGYKENILRVEVTDTSDADTDPFVFPGVASYSNHVMFLGMGFKDTAWDTAETYRKNAKYIIRIQVNKYAYVGEIIFLTAGSEEFMVTFDNREFYVKAPNLWAAINSVMNK